MTGTLIRAGRMQVEDDMLTGVFIEMSGPEIMRLSRKGLYNKRVVVIIDRRRELKKVEVERRS
jgi:hypothetical protein